METDIGLMSVRWSHVVGYRLPQRPPDIPPLSATALIYLRNWAVASLSHCCVNRLPLRALLQQAYQRFVMSLSALNRAFGARSFVGCCLLLVGAGGDCSNSAGCQSRKGSDHRIALPFFADRL